MQDFRGLTGLVQREGDGYVALCPELDIASQGETVEEARRNLTEAVELFLETADQTEISLRLPSSELPSLAIFSQRVP